MKIVRTSYGLKIVRTSYGLEYIRPRCLENDNGIIYFNGTHSERKKTGLNLVVEKGNRTGLNINPKSTGVTFANGNKTKEDWKNPQTGWRTNRILHI